MQLLEATVKYPGRVYSTKFGERVNAVFTSESGEEIVIWGPIDYAPLSSLKRGDRAQLVKDSKGNYRLVESRESNGSAPPVVGWSPEQKQAIAAKVVQDAELLRFCLVTAQNKLGDLVSPEDVRALGITLFLQAVK